jgi:hypothetical protein
VLGATNCAATARELPPYLDMEPHGLLAVAKPLAKHAKTAPAMPQTGLQIGLSRLIQIKEVEIELGMQRAL